MRSMHERSVQRMQLDDKPNVRNPHRAQSCSESAKTLRFAPDTESLRTALDGAEVLFGWDCDADNLREAWNRTTTLRWIHWCGAGVDGLPFHDLMSNDVVLTNARGIFDRAMAEFTLGRILAFAKRFPETMKSQAKRRWDHKFNEQIDNKHVLVVGVGSIGREIARLLRTAGMRVTDVGRSARAGDPDFDAIHAFGELNGVLGDADYVIAVMQFVDNFRRYRASEPLHQIIDREQGFAAAG